MAEGMFIIVYAPVMWELLVFSGYVVSDHMIELSH